MKRKIYLLLFVLILFLLSCFGNKTNTDLIVSSTPLKAEQGKSIIITVEDVKEAIYEYEEEYIRRYNTDIVFIEKANFGIPGGDNWIVGLGERVIMIYVIDERNIKREYNLTSFNLENRSNFNIMQDIPGTRVGNSTSSFGDFNGDGVDEIFGYGFGGNASLITIDGYNSEKDDFVSYTFNSWITFEIIDPENGPAPVEFMTYNGMYGFKVFFFQYGVAGGPGYVSEPNPKNGKWIFYTWDAEKREYVEVEEVFE